MNRKQRRSAVEPSNVEGQLSLRTEFYRDILTRITKGIFKITKPKTWELDFILNTLMFKGCVAITETTAGVIPLYCGTSGNNYWHFPTKANFAVPVLGNFTRTIGEDCELIFLERTVKRTFWNFGDLIDIYAYKLAAADAAIDVNIFNSKLGFIAEAETKGQADTIKAMYNKISEGEPLVVYRADSLQKDGLKVFFGEVKKNFIADVLQDSKRSIINEYLTLIGVNNANTDKRERLITGEVEANNVELSCNISLWKENLSLQVEKINSMFNDINFNIELQFDQINIEGEDNDIVGRNRDMENQNEQ